mmetsp:Transcript_1535/g.3181  ORF Transcript_1535/g.3181 Transcript_1535/m.3181 type:complete len:217 (+) Transcript_1535:633-1283(+)
MVEQAVGSAQAQADGVLLHVVQLHAFARRAHAPVVLRHQGVGSEPVGLPVARVATQDARQDGVGLVPDGHAVGHAGQVLIRLGRLHAQLPLHAVGAAKHLRHGARSRRAAVHRAHAGPNHASLFGMVNVHAWLALGQESRLYEVDANADGAVPQMQLHALPQQRAHPQAADAGALRLHVQVHERERDAVYHKLDLPRMRRGRFKSFQARAVSFPPV